MGGLETGADTRTDVAYAPPLRRRSGFALTGILPSASPPSQTAFPAVRELYIITITKKPPHSGGFFVMVPTHGLEPRTH